MDELVASLVASGVGTAVGPLLVQRVGLGIARSAERRAIQNPRLVNGAQASWAALFPSAIFGLIVAASLPLLQKLPQSTRVGLQGIAFFLFGGLVLLVMLLHSMPNQRRARKYNALILAGIAWQVAQSIKSRRSFVTPLEFGWVYGLFLVLGPIVHRMLRLSEAMNWLDSAGLLRTYRLVLLLRGAGPISFLVLVALTLLIPGFSAAYLTVRFFLLEKLSRTPVLYLRSFAEQDATNSFSRVITPAVVSCLPVTGLVSQTQTGGLLNEQVHYSWRSRFHAVIPSVWQQWVLDQIPRAAGAIIDARTGTAGVLWELQTALRHLPRERLLILIDDAQTTLPDGSSLPSGVDVLRIPAAASKAQRRIVERTLRQQTRDWVQGRLIPSLTGRPFAEPGWLRIIQPPAGPGLGPTALAYLVLIPSWIGATLVAYHHTKKLESIRVVAHATQSAEAEAAITDEQAMARLNIDRYYGEYGRCPSTKALCDERRLPPSACSNPSTEPINCIPMLRPRTDATGSQRQIDRSPSKCRCVPGDPLCSCL